MGYSWEIDLTVFPQHLFHDPDLCVHPGKDQCSGESDAQRASRNTVWLKSERAIEIWNNAWRGF